LPCRTHETRRPGQFLPGQRPRLFGDELLRAAATRRRLADRHRPFGGDEPTLRAQIESLIDRKLPLSLLPLRLNEFMSIQNIDPFTLYFNVKECFTGNPDAAFWFDFGAGSDSGKDTLDTLNITTIGREETIRSARSAVPLRSIRTDPPDRERAGSTDEATNHVHLGHVDTHLARKSRRSLIIEDGDDDPTDFDKVRSFLLNTATGGSKVSTPRSSGGHRQYPEQARHRKRSRRAMAASCVARRPSRAHQAARLTCSSARQICRNVALRQPRRGKVIDMAMRHQGTLTVPTRCPRSRAGHLRLGECLEQRQQGKIYHGCNASFLIVGETHRCLVETGHPKDFPITEGQAQQVLPAGRR